jgi:hypothetical protein
VTRVLRKKSIAGSKNGGDEGKVRDKLKKRISRDRDQNKIPMW